MDNIEIGKKISRLRKQLEMSTTDLAAKTGLSQPQISRLENGRQGFRSATLSRIASALSVPPAYFFSEEKK
jgi:transcriptional regulator with XRE-family HTH domain